MSLAQKAGKAASLLLFRKMWGALVNIGVMAYLARTLDTADFGLVAISGTLIGFIQTLGVSGIGEYVIFYNGEDQKNVFNAAFWLSMALTGLIVVVVLIAAPFWSDTYKDPRIFNLICLLLVGFVFSMLSTIPTAIFRKSLDYKPMVTILTIFGTLSQLSQAAFAFLGFGVYSLALPSAIIAPLMALALFWRSGFRPRWNEMGISYWKQIFSYTKHVIGSRLLTKFANEGDTLLIGKLLGMEALGIYDIAFKLANIFNNNLLPIVTSISLPVFATDSIYIKQVQRRYLKMSSSISFLFFPVCGLMILIAPSLITLLYGAKWQTSIIPFQILTIFAAFRAISSPTSGIFNAFNKPQYSFYFSLIFVPIFLFGLYLSAGYGLVATCWAVTILRVFGGFVLVYFSLKLIDLTLIDLYGEIASILIITILMTLPVLMHPLFLSIPWTILLSMGYIFVFLLINRMLRTNALITFTELLVTTNPSIGRFITKILSL